MGGVPDVVILAHAQPKHRLFICQQLIQRTLHLYRDLTAYLAHPQPVAAPSDVDKASIRPPFKGFADKQRKWPRPVPASDSIARHEVGFHFGSGAAYFHVGHLVSVGQSVPGRPRDRG